jgi:hypothetical protein
MENILFIHGALGSKLQFEPIMEALKGFWYQILPRPYEKVKLDLLLPVLKDFIK